MRIAPCRDPDERLARIRLLPQVMSLYKSSGHYCSPRHRIGLVGCRRNKMDMPGFTAETSVYVTRNRYFGAAHYIALGGGVVITAAIFLRGGYRYCSQICQGDILRNVASDIQDAVNLSR